MPGIRKWTRRSDLLWLMAFELLRYLSFRTCCDITETNYSSLSRELIRVIKSGEIDWEGSYEHQELPQAKMVLDKFHLIRDANMKIDEAWRIEQGATKKEIKRKEFYWVKEKLRETYRFEGSERRY